MDRKPHELLFKLVADLAEKKKRDLTDVADRIVEHDQKVQKKDKDWQKLTSEVKRLEELTRVVRQKLTKVESRYKANKWRLVEELGHKVDDEAVRVKVRLLIEDRSKVESVLEEFLKFQLEP